MLSKIIILVAVVMTTITGYLFVNRYIQQRSVTSNQNATKKAASKPQTIPLENVRRSIFISYWADFSESLDLDTYDRAIYFGVAPTISGINTAEQGYLNLNSFIENTPEIERWLTLRMVNTDLNLRILEDSKNWENITSEIIELAKENGFAGVVLDLEVSTLPSDEVVGEITSFATTFASAVKKENLKVALTMYGDTFYRNRPYDLEKIVPAFDEVLIMAYDMHKAGGEPGPNFPLQGKEKYGYDFETMISDFLSIIPQEKVDVIFGMYGYDWITDEKKRPLKPATALSYTEIQKKYATDCDAATCVIKRDELSAEMEINQVESVFSEERDQYDLYPHIIWYEDEHSVERKTKFLQEQGISQISFWTYGYF